MLLGPLEGVEDLPVGWVDDQGPGHYRLRRQEGSRRLFDWTTGPQALKPLSFAPQETLWRSELDAQGALAFRSRQDHPPPVAVIGVRGCDLAALALQDAHFLGGPEPDPLYQIRRASLFLVGVDCARSAPTCFCASTGDGPALSTGFDLGLSELDEGFLVRSGTPAGQEVIDALGLPPPARAQIEQAGAASAAAAAAQSRRLPSADRLAKLFERLDHQRWKAVAARCLACGNCTAVCPSCFCFTVESRPSRDGRSAKQIRSWDSCFSQGHSAVHGSPVRPDVCSRYRQWATHKLAGWQQQYGRSGCVGCGRCIGWCPAGIDIVEEACAMLGEIEDE